MKRFLTTVLLILLIPGLIACGSLNAQQNPSPAATEKIILAPSASTPASIPVLDGLTAANLSKIVKFDDSRPPNVPSAVYLKQKEIETQLEMLRNYRIMKKTERIATAAPGDWSRYELFCLNGNLITISFFGNNVDFGQGSYIFEKK